MYYRIGVCSKNYCHDGVLPAVGVLVGDDGVKLSAAQRGFVDAQVRAYILRKHAPSLRVKALGRVLPLPIAAQMALVLTLEQIAVYIEEPFKRAARNRVSVQAYLLKKPQTLSRSGCLRLLNPNVG